MDAKEAEGSRRPARLTKGRATAFALATLAIVLCWYAAQIDIGRLINGLPRLAGWIAAGWPPETAGLPLLLWRAVETVAMATLGSLLGVLIAAPVCILAARNITPEPWLYHPARAILNFLRGIDSFVFALIFVAAVGLGPFAGVIGIGLHSAGIVAKLWSEQIETAPPGPLEAAALTGASRFKLLVFSVLPDSMPGLSSAVLYTWESNVRSSTVLGIVGAGGLGQELKNAVDLLNFHRVITIIAITLIMVTIIDQISAYLRRKLM